MNRNELPESMKTFSLPEYREIPDIGLYLDQVVKYINRIVSEFPQLQVTGSMIANYVKQKIIPKAEKKAYSREQIGMLVLIVLAKRVLSIEQIRTVLTMLEETGTTQEYYTRFRQSMEYALTNHGTDDSDMLDSLASAVVHGMYLDYVLQNHEL